MSTTYHKLSAGPLLEDWSDTGLLTANDDWTRVPSIMGYLGDISAATTAGVDPRTLTAAAPGAVDVNANQTNPTTFTTGGVAEFQIANPTVALTGSGTADAPSLVIHLDTTGQEQVRVAFNARDVEGSTDDATQPVAVQYRVGADGPWVNVEGGYAADVTTVSAAAQVTPFELVLPADAANQPQVQVRILTTNAVGADEWVGIDDIRVSGTAIAGPQPTLVSVGDVTLTEANGSTLATFTVTRSDASSAFSVDFATASGTALAGSDFTPASGTLTFAAGGPLTQTFTVEILGDALAEPDETFTVNLSNLVATAGQATLADASAAGTILNDDVPLVRIAEVQGAGAASARVGQTVTVEAIVTADFQGGARLGGFFIQEEDSDQDGNAATSEGIFVFQGDALLGFADVQVGDKVRITATVAEFQGETQLTAPAITVLSSGNPLPTAATVALPTVGTVANNAGAPIADLEAYEGMRVTFEQALTLTETFNLDRFGEYRLTAGERPAQYTQENDPDVTGYQAHLADVAARTITVDDGLRSQNPNPIAGSDSSLSTADAFRLGERVEDLTSVVRFSRATSEFGLGSSNQTTYRILPTVDPVFTSETGSPLNPRDAAPADVGGTLKVGSFNVLNYFRTLNTINDGSNNTNPADDTALGFDPRGANTAVEFERQTDKLVEAILGLDADVLGLIELENDFREGAAGNALAYLVAELNAATPEDGSTYDWVRPGRDFVGGDAIAVGFIYKTDTVRIASGTSVSILDDSDVAPELLERSTLDRLFNGENTSRAALAVTFEEISTGGDFTAVVNHFKSKSGNGTAADADQGDGAGAWNAQRSLAAEALAAWIAGDPTGTQDDDYLILGDLNAYAMESPIDVLRGAGFEDLQARLENPYSYVFDGQTGTLDYILANGAMGAQVTGVAEWHINADEADALDYNLDFARDPSIFDGAAPYRVSDHDPLLVGLDLAEEPGFTLQLLHLADGEAGLLAPRTAPNLAALVDAFDGLYANTLILAGGDNWLPGPFLAAGTDPSVIPTLNRVSGSTLAANATVPIGAVDIAIHNAIGVEASAIGNHEFDLGSRVFRDSFSPGGGWVGADFVHVSANLDFSGDADLSSRFTDTVGNGATPTPEASTLKGRIVPAAIITEGGEKIGIVGATTQILEAISSPSGTEVKGFPTGAGPNGERDDMDLLAAQLQPVIDELIAEGVNKIILQAHLQQIGNEKLLASKLKGVDIILSAGSNTRLGDEDDEAVAFPGHAADFADTYPLVIQNAEGKPTLIVNTDNEYTYLGRLVVEFDANGEIKLDSLAANKAINGAYASTAENVAEAWGTTVDQLGTTAFAEGTKGDKVRDLTQAVQEVINVKDSNVYGFTNVYLEGERAFVRSQETNLGNLSADANGEALQDALGLGATGDGGAFVVSLKNGGGIRAQIGTLSDPKADGTVDKLPPPANEDTGKPEGGVSQLDVENSLRFDNKLMAVDLSAEDLKAVIEHGVAAWPNQGRFPQIGGVEFSWDPDLPPGSRVRDIALVDEAGNPLVGLYDDGVLMAGAPAKITVVTLNFLANGGDGYPIKTLGENFRFLLADGTLSAPVDPALNFTAPAVVPANALGEQQAFREYMQEFHATPETAFDQADTEAALDQRIQNLNFRGEDVLAGLEIQSVRFAEASLQVAAAEGTGEGAALAFTVERSGGTRGDVAFTVELASSVATGADFDGGAALPRTISGVIRAGETSATITVQVAGDALPEADEGFTLALTGVQNSRGVVTGVAAEGSTATGTIVNDDYAIRDVAGTNKADVFTDAFLFSTTYRGGSGDDVARGEDGHDRLIGENGNDRLFGGSGLDTLEGGRGDDRLDGGAGDDRLVGGQGDDVLFGGAGADAFVFGKSSGADRITGGFTLGEDGLLLEEGVGIARIDQTGEGLLVHLAGSGTVLIEGLSGPVAGADLLWHV